MRQTGDSVPAKQALRKCKPAALTTLVAYLDSDASPDFLVAYHAAVALTGGGGAAKPDAWWKSAAAEDRAKEISRIREIARKKAQV